MHKSKQAATCQQVANNGGFEVTTAGNSKQNKMKECTLKWCVLAFVFCLASLINLSPRKISSMAVIGGAAHSASLFSSDKLVRQVKVGAPIIISQHPLIILEKGIIHTGTHQPIGTSIQNGLSNNVVIADQKWLDSLANSSVKRLQIEEAQISVRPQKRPASSTPHLTLNLPGSKIHTLYLNSGSFLIYNKKADPSKITLNNISIKMHYGKISLAGTIHWHNQEVKINGITNLPRNFGKDTPLPLQLSLNTNYTKAQFKGAVYGEDLVKLEGNLNLKIQDLRFFSNWLGHHLPSGPGLNLFETQGKFIWQDERAHLENALFNLDGNKAMGTVTLNTEHARPKLTGTIAVKHLDLTNYLKERETFLKIPDPLGLQQPKSFDLSMLNAFDADLRLSAEKLTIGKLTSTQNALSFFQNNGQAIFDIAEANICDGAATGNMKVNSNYKSPRWSMNMLLKNVKASECLHYLLPKPAIEGRANVKLYLTSNGASFAALKKQVRGKAEIESVNKSQTKINLKNLFGKEKPSISSWQAFSKKSANLQNLTAKFVINQGKAVSEFFQVETPSRIFSGKGRIDLSQGHLNWLISSKEKEKEPLKAEQSLKPTECFAVDGKLDSPHIKPHKGGNQANKACPQITPSSKVQKTN